jgi:DNA polymerase IV
VEASIQEKVTASISKEKRDLQSAKFAKMKSAEPFVGHSINSITPSSTNEDWSKKIVRCLLFAVVRDFRVQEQGETHAIIHLDMDCFYAAIEVRDRPSLRGKPVGVGGARDRRGVLTTCNYEARKFGVRSAMPTFMALQRCPNLIVLPTRFDVYRREAAVVRGILHRFTSLIEPLSLDEAYLDVTAHPGAPGPLARVIRGTIFRKTKLTSSAGIGPNKLIAKIASEINKPNGQFEVPPEQVPAFMKKLPVRKIWGIGEKTEKKLEELGVKTCGELQRFSRPELVDLFGKFGLDLYDLCRGIDHRKVEPDRPRKSLSTEETFPIDLTTVEQCEEKLEDLFQEVMADLAQKEATRFITKIFVKLKFNDFTRTTAERAGLAPTLEDFRSLLDEAFARTGKPVRLIGVGVRFAETTPESAQMHLL